MTAASVAAIILFTAGWFTAKYSSTNNKIIAVKSNKDFMLLLFNTPNFNSQQATAKEYETWMKSIQKDSIEISGEELAMQERWLGKTNSTTRENVLGGYFIISNTTEAKATEIASTCPHLKYNGNIAIKQIVR